MSLSITDVEKIALLARLAITPKETEKYAQNLSNILDFVSELNAIDTANIEPLAHPLDLTQRLRDDVVTETNQRDQFQAIAPKALVGLYLVPKVIADVDA